jgi:tetratricopeptide (TPR) repeat protein
MIPSSSLTRFRRRTAFACFVLAALSFGIAFAAAPATATRPASRPAISAADKAAAEAQYDKANALYQQGKYAEAQVENEKALKLDPANFNALLMRRVLEGKLSNLTPAGGESQPAAVAAQGKISLLTTQQVSMIRLMELGSADTRITGRIDPKVLEDFWQNVILKDDRQMATRAAHDAFINPANFPAQVRRIRESREVKYMEQITLNTDPAAFDVYRRNVQTFVLSNCATAECHSETGQGGNFRLVNPARSTEQQYTDFYILNQYANADGKMIDRATAEKSLLVQYSLPWANASAKHPKIDIRRLSGPRDSRLSPILDWINSLGFTKPDYHIDYPVPGAATAPAVPTK